MTFESIFTAAASLPVEERIRLIDQLAATVPDDYSPPPSAEWREEAARRWNEYQAGRMTASDWKDVRQRVFGPREVTGGP